MTTREDLAAECKRLATELSRVERRHRINEATGWEVVEARDAFHASIDALAACQPEQQAVEPCRIPLVVAIHTLASHYENALYALDPEARKVAEGDIAHARKIAAQWNWNGAAQTPGMCSSFCHPGERCSITADGACDALQRHQPLGPQSIRGGAQIVGASAQKPEPVAYEFVCKRAPSGGSMTYASPDPDDTAHWPMDQWRSVLRTPLAPCGPAVEMKKGAITEPAEAAVTEAAAQSDVLNEAMRLAANYGNACQDWGDYRGHSDTDTESLYRKTQEAKEALRTFLAAHLRSAEDERDAARYRWLRAEHDRVNPICHLSWKMNGDRGCGEWVNTAILDAAIDAAIGKEGD